MSAILSHLQSEYSKNPFPFFTTVEITNRFKEDTQAQLNELRENGFIRRREGINGILIELLKFE